MVASDLHRKSSGSLDLALQSLDISSPVEKLHVSFLDEPASAYDCSSSSSSEDEEDPHEVRKSPFHVYYLREDGGSSSGGTRRGGCCEAVPADADCCECSNSPSTTCSHGVSWTKRETLLSEAWERKRKLMLQEELKNLKDRAQPELLGRSASCVKPMTDACSLLKLGKLDRSVSDCGKPSSRVWGMRTRSLTDDDFEELKGCIDLGFRFDQRSITDLCDTLPALEVCCAVAQNFQDSPCCTSPDSSVTVSPSQSITPSPTPSWRIASPGDDPEEIKERLRHWAQAVACTTRLCY